ncbi:MAG: exodeoxyribonuclease VII small subunit [Planctomycetota bacterium]|jgi:exodeoxyribonuclease VII small subunit|nr:exodeoxyribonuclease VII small subunit [Planctomycetota bacterium]
MTANAKDESKPSFEVSFDRLEEIVKVLESGQGTLDESITLYEEGMACLKCCHDLLKKAEKKIQLLMTDEEGKPYLQDFTGADTSDSESS